MLKIKICGLSREEDIETVNRYKPDYAGFVLAPSKRRVSEGQAFSLIKVLSPEILPVGVFADMPGHHVAELVKQCGLAGVQLHGEEDNTYLAGLRSLLPEGVMIIKAVRMSSRQDLNGAAKIPCDLLLFDSCKQGTAGGTGKVFDWNLLKGFSRPYLLAGGLNCANLKQAIEMINPYGVDVSSGVETGGHKDPDKIRNFITTAKEVSK